MGFGLVAGEALGLPVRSDGPPCEWKSQSPRLRLPPRRIHADFDRSQESQMTALAQSRIGSRTVPHFLKSFGKRGELLAVGAGSAARVSERCSMPFA